MPKKKTGAPAPEAYKVVMGDRANLQPQLNVAAELGYRVHSAVVINPSLIYVFMEHESVRPAGCCLVDADEAFDKMGLVGEAEEPKKRGTVDLTPDN